MSVLAINGGKKIRDHVFPAYKVIGNEEEMAVKKVIHSGVLSKYLGCWHDDFYGGENVQALEIEWSDYFGAKYAITVNSASSGILVAVGAAGVGPGDEVIVTPFSMSVSAVAPLYFNAVPVFADIEADHFCLDPDSIRKKITPRTKAIIVVDLFGQTFSEEIISIAKENNLILIEDTAQAPNAKSHGKSAGTLGDIGIYSLNYHKHIHSGEGGIAVTDDYELAERMRMIRNHAEAVVDDRGMDYYNNFIGFNLRMTELEAAVAREQLKKLESLYVQRRANVKYLESKLKHIPALELVKERVGSEHAYYVHPIKYKMDELKIHRNTFVEAVKAELSPIELREQEGVPVVNGYVKPLYLQSIYQKKIAYGGTSCPFGCPLYKGTVDYHKGICPTCENLYENELIFHELIRPPMTEKDLDDVYLAFEKVYHHREELL